MKALLVLCTAPDEEVGATLARDLVERRLAACVNVLGLAFGELGSNFQPVSDAGTWVLSFAMILGRLEYFTVFSLFTWQFWRS